MDSSKGLRRWELTEEDLEQFWEEYVPAPPTVWMSLDAYKRFEELLLLLDKEKNHSA